MSDKILFFTDVHIYPYFELAEELPMGSTTYLQEVEKSFDWLCELIEEHKPKFVVCGGDTAHTQGSIDALSCTTIYSTYKKIQKACFQAGSELEWILGNHDIYIENDEGVVCTIPFINSVEAPFVSKTKCGDLSIALVPYTADLDSVYTFLNAIPDKHIVFSHLNVNQAVLSGASDFISEKGLDVEKVPDHTVCVINGDYHKPQKVGKIILPGSMMYHSFSDSISEEPRGALLVEVSGEDITTTKYENPHTSIYHSVKAKTGKKATELLDTLISNKEIAARTFARVVYSGEDEVDFSIYEPHFKRIKVINTGKARTRVSRLPELTFETEPLSAVKSYCDHTECDVDLDLAEAYIDKAKEDLCGTKSTVSIDISAVQAKNFFSLGDISYEVDEPDIVLIEGKNKDSTSATSNGAGKSSTVECILWCLFNKTLRSSVKSDDVINRHAEGGTSVSVTFSKGDKEYVVRRTRGHDKLGNSLRILVDDHNITPRTNPAANELLAKIIGMSFQEFVHTTYLRGNVHRFINLGDRERKELLEDIIGSSVYKECEKNIKEDISDVNKSLTDILLDYAKVNATYVQRQADYDSAVTDLTSFESSILEQERGYRDTIEKSSAELFSLERKVADVNSEIESFEEIIKGFSDEIRLQEHRLAEVFEEITEISIEGKSLSVQIDHLSEVKELESCPMCQQSAPEEHVNKEILDRQGTMETLYEGRDKLDENHRDLQRALDDILNEKRTAEREVSGLKSILDTHKQTKNSLISSLSEAKIRVEGIDDRRKSLVSRRDKLKQDLDFIRESRTKLSESKRRLEKKDKELSDLVSIFSPQGVRSFVLDKAIDFINERLAHYVVELTTGELPIKLKPTKSSKKNTVDKIDIEFAAGPSSGEETRLDLIIQFALADLLGSFRGLPNILVLDEIEKGLDPLGIEKLILSLRTSLDRTVFVMSHANHLKGLVNTKWSVNKSGGVSTLARHGNG